MSRREDGNGPPAAGNGEVESDLTASVAGRLARSLEEQRTRLEALCSGANGLSGDALHDVRVALRRAGAIARLLRGFPGKGDGRDLGPAARDLRKALSPSRSHEVCRSRLLRRFPRDEARRAAARSVVARMVPPGQAAAPTPGAILDALGPLLGARIAHLRQAAEEARPEVERRLLDRLGRRLRRRRRRLLDLGVPERSGIHRFRIETKHLRYALEPFEEEIPGTRELLKTLRRLQDAAGDAHDREEVVAVLKADARRTPGARDAARLLLPVLERDAERAAERTQRLARRVLAEASALPMRFP